MALDELIHIQQVVPHKRLAQHLLKHAINGCIDALLPRAEPAS